MASPNTLKLTEERRQLRQSCIKITQPFLIYGANRQTRRSQLRKTYKEAFTDWGKAKEAIRQEDRKKLKEFTTFSRFLKTRIEEIKAEFEAKGESISETEAFEIVKKRAEEEARIKDKE